MDLKESLAALCQQRGFTLETVAANTAGDLPDASMTENGDGTGTAYVPQYFQNARLEYHPEAKDARFSVQLGLLGDQLLRQKGWLQ